MEGHNWLITSKEIVPVAKSYPQTEAQVQMASLLKPSKHMKKN
jgi:hypothetical protein